MNVERFEKMRLSYGRRYPLGVLGSLAALPRPEEKWSGKDQLMQTEVGCWTGSWYPRELAQSRLSNKEDKLGVSLFTAVHCILRAQGRFCRAEAATADS